MASSSILLRALCGPDLPDPFPPPVSPNTTFANALSPCLVEALIPVAANVLSFSLLLFTAFYALALAPRRKLHSTTTWRLRWATIAALHLYAVFQLLSATLANATRPEVVYALSSLFAAATILLIHLLAYSFGIVSCGAAQLAALVHFAVCILAETPHLSSINSEPRVLGSFLYFGLFLLHFMEDRLESPTNYERLEAETELEDEREPNKEVHAPLYRRLIFAHVTRMFDRSKPQRVPELAERDSVPFLTARFERFFGISLDEWVAKGASPDHLPAIFWPLLRTIWHRSSGGVILFLLFVTITNLNPVFIKLFSTIDSQPFWYWNCIALVCFLSAIVSRFIVFRSRWYNVGSYVQIKTILIPQLFAKMSRLSSTGDAISSGELLTLATVDVERAKSLFMDIYRMIVTPISAIYLGFLIYFLLGWSGLIGVIACVIWMPINILFFSKMKKWQTRAMERTEERVGQVREFIAAVKVVKMYAWEKWVAARIEKLRTNELWCCLRTRIYDEILEVNFHLAPITGVVVSLLIECVVIGRPITAVFAILTVQLYNTLRYSIIEFPFGVTRAMQGMVSLRRIVTFLTKDEKETVAEPPKGMAVAMHNCSLTWSARRAAAERVEHLKKINLTLETGKFYAVVGKIGSGKSNLLRACIGEMDVLSGHRLCQSKHRAYVPQTAYVENACARDNVAYSRRFIEEQYRNALDACVMLEEILDIERQPGKKFARLGERGVKLSGGQKMRLSLARAVYERASFVIADDPLAAVDAHVAVELARRLFDSATGAFGRATRLVATNQRLLLPLADRIFVMRDGEIVDEGTWGELSQRSEGDFFDLFVNEAAVGKKPDGEGLSESASTERLTRYLSNQPSWCDRPSELRTSEENDYVVKQQTPDFDDRIHRSAVRSSEEEEDELDEQEMRGVARKNASSVLLDYARLVGIKWCILYLTMLFGGCTLLETAAAWWLIIWTGGHTIPSGSQHLGVLVFVTLMLGRAAAQLISQVTWAIVTTNCSRKLHARLLDSVLRAKAAHFDRTPVGVVIARFSKDMETIDTDLPAQAGYISIIATEVLVSVVVVAVLEWRMIFLLLPVGLVVVKLLAIYLPTTVACRRLSSHAYSVLLASLENAYSGLPTICGFSRQNVYLKRANRLITRNIRCDYTESAAIRYTAIRLDLLTSVVVFAAIWFSSWRAWNLEIDIARYGLILNHAMLLFGYIAELAHIYREFEVKLVAVERVQSYLALENEGSWEPSTDDTREPEDGSITFTGVSLSYGELQNLGSSSEGPLALDDINLTIRNGERIGVIGRTGAGKSSLLAVLFRLAPPTRGKVILGGVDCATMGLHVLRKHVAVIPQDPTLFTGPLRSNIDPFGMHSDDEIRHVVEVAGLKNAVSRLADGLDAQVGEGGANFSVGERQLVCLARVLLRKDASVIVLDEASASVDNETDQRIAAAVAGAWPDRTLIIVAHRLRTVAACDRLLVMKDGRVAEFDSPAVLAARKDSLYAKLLRQQRQ